MSKITFLLTFIAGIYIGSLGKKPMYYALYYMPESINPYVEKRYMSHDEWSTSPDEMDLQEKRLARIDEYYKDLKQKMNE